MSSEIDVMAGDIEDIARDVRRIASKAVQKAREAKQLCGDTAHT